MDRRDLYSLPELKAIARSYATAYENGIGWYEGQPVRVTNPFRIAEMRADYLRAKQECGKDYILMLEFLNGEIGE